jgi:hypothetical protein
MAKAIPEGYPSVRPYLHVDGAAEAIDLYEKALALGSAFDWKCPVARSRTRRSRSLTRL